MIDFYEKIIHKHQQKFDVENRKYNIVSFTRLATILLIVFCFVKYLQKGNIPFLIAVFFLLLIFLFFVKYHNKIDWKRKLQKTIIKINKDEISFLKKVELPFKDGREYRNYNHLYSYDLDIFGENSLYQYLNRTSTYIGEKTLSDLLSNLLPDKEIKENQATINELKKETEWRQKIYAISRTINDNSEKYRQLVNWSQRREKRISKTTIFLSYLLPFLFISSVIIQFYTKIEWLYQLSVLIFLFNLSVTYFHFKKLKSILITSEEIKNTLKRYSLILSEIENIEVKSKKLVKLKNSLVQTQDRTSVKIKQLSNLFAQMENFLNVFGSFISNGFLLYHIHIYRKIANWKQDNAKQITTWLNVIGEIETLNSLANFAFNNPNFCFPKINENSSFRFEEIGHPMINPDKRITNNIFFEEYPFIVLTGSNMSGKSTFLRTIGVNLVLARVGSVVCAKEAHVKTLQILVSMRINDSLANEESYFFAEIKRLKEISQQAKLKPSFILLDEILRGTNSDDKRKGTKEYLKTLIQTSNYGIIATHDLDICNLKKDYSLYLSNKYFDVKIEDDELFFDYKLIDGVCKSQNASFLMRKMKIIE